MARHKFHRASGTVFRHPITKLQFALEDCKCFLTILITINSTIRRIQKLLHNYFHFSKVILSSSFHSFMFFILPVNTLLCVIMKHYKHVSSGKKAITHVICYIAPFNISSFILFLSLSFPILPSFSYFLLFSPQSSI